MHFFTSGKIKQEGNIKREKEQEGTINCLKVIVMLPTDQPYKYYLHNKVESCR